MDAGTGILMIFLLPHPNTGASKAITMQIAVNLGSKYGLGNVGDRVRDISVYRKQIFREKCFHMFGSCLTDDPQRIMGSVFPSFPDLLNGVECLLEYRPGTFRAIHVAYVSFRDQRVKDGCGASVPYPQVPLKQ